MSRPTLTAKPKSYPDLALAQVLPRPSPDPNPGRSCPHRCEFFGQSCPREAAHDATEDVMLPFGLKAVDGEALLWESSVVKEMPVPKALEVDDSDEMWDLF